VIIVIVDSGGGQKKSFLIWGWGCVGEGAALDFYIYNIFFLWDISLITRISK